MLDAFKIKPFDLEPALEQWKDGPRFKGNPKKDLPVEEWLEKIKAGCIERGIPEECWHKAAQHFMGPKAKARLDEVKAVVTKVNGGKYRWTWKKFKIAMNNMGWGIDTSAIETIKVHGKGLSLWFMRKKDDKKEDKPSSESTSKRSPSRSSSLWTIPRRNSVDDKTPEPSNRRPHRSNSDFFWPKKSTNEIESSPKRNELQKTKTDSVTTSHASSKQPSESGSDVSVVTNAPVWLLNACTALDFLTSEHPKAMSILSAILITAGSLPAIPALTAGAGGAVLASGAAQAIGAIAVGIGQALGTSVVKNNHSEAQASSSRKFLHSLTKYPRTSSTVTKT
ncbi:hypothetical protein AX17_003054 [Amanita inopinata Kibby_2008]|nr:hypothetical protein AX17_003054 [Amanita inopinata Kibby_2008]